jgi:hypothetical protein
LYANSSAGDKNQPTELNDAAKSFYRIPTFRHIRISNLTATCPKSAGLIAGLPESYVTDVILENVTISAAKPFFITNAKGVQLKSVAVTVPEKASFKLENAQVFGLPKL